MKNEISRNDLSGTIVLCHHELGQLLNVSGANYVGYNSGIYGWNWDAYSLGEFTFVFGNRNFKKIDIMLDYRRSKELGDALRKLSQGQRGEFLLKELRKLV